MSGRASDGWALLSAHSAGKEKIVKKFRKKSTKKSREREENFKNCGT